MDRGEIWWYEPPNQSARPYVILSRQAAIPVLHRVVAIPTTRTRRGIPTEVDLSREMGMPADCVLSADNVTVIDKAYCTSRITTLDSTVLAAACRALAYAVDCQ
jgi:mRNA interferase MazF